MAKGPSRRQRRDDATAKLRSAVESIQAAVSEFEDAKSELEALKEEMENWYDGMPEGLQASDQGQRVEAAKDLLDEVINNMDIDIDELVSNLESAADQADEVDFPGMYGR